MADFLARYTGELIGAEWLLTPVHRLAAVLYLHGPSFQLGSVHLGFWQGKDLTDICSALTGVRSQLWADNPAACERIVAERFFGVYYSLYIASVVWVVWRVACSTFRALGGRLQGRREVTLSLQSAEWAALAPALRPRLALPQAPVACAAPAGPSPPEPPPPGAPAPAPPGSPRSPA